MFNNDFSKVLNFDGKRLSDFDGYLLDHKDINKYDEVKTDLKALNLIKSRINNKQLGSDEQRGYLGFMDLLGLMSSEQYHVSLEIAIDDYLYPDNDSGVDGSCYGFEAMEWLGDKLSDGADDLARTRKIITAINGLGLLLPNDDGSAVAVTVNGVDDIHRVRVSEMNAAIDKIATRIKND